MFTKAGLLLALALVFLGYRWGRRKALERMQPPPAAPVYAAPANAPAAAPKKEWLSVRTLLIIVAVLLVIAILSSLSGRVG